jgi:hypothetical protein
VVASSKTSGFSIKTVQFNVEYDLANGDYATATAAQTAIESSFETAIEASTLDTALEKRCDCDATVDFASFESARAYPTLEPSPLPTLQDTTWAPSSVATLSPMPTWTDKPTHIPTPSPTGLCRNLCKYSSSGLYEQVRATPRKLIRVFSRYPDKSCGNKE